jgi:hypothetical protein
LRAAFDLYHAPQLTKPQALHITDNAPVQISFFEIAIPAGRVLEFAATQPRMYRPKKSQLQKYGAPFQAYSILPDEPCRSVAFVMRSLLEVLREKEVDLARVRQEVEALRFVAPLLFERDDQFRDPSEVLWPETPPKNRWPLEVDELRQVSPGL